MARKGSAPEDTPAEEKTPAVSPAPPRTFPVETLRRNCVTLFGCTTSTFDGAFFSCADREYSIEEAKEIIKKWLRKEIKE